MKVPVGRDSMLSHTVKGFCVGVMTLLFSNGLVCKLFVLSILIGILKDTTASNLDPDKCFPHG